METDPINPRRLDLRGVILDVDGTLVDSVEAHARAWVEALGEAGHQVELGRVRRMIGMGGDKLLAELAGVEKESADGKAISGRRAEIFKQRFLADVRPFPQARRLVERLRADGFQVVVASSAQEDELGALLERAEVRDLIDDATSADDARRSKPDPDIVAAALRQLDMRPEETLMIGDTPYDIEAAARAGVPTLALRAGGWRDEELDGALAVYQDPADLLARYDESPFAQTARTGGE